MKQNDCPLVSVVMAVYNAESYVEEAIKSVESQTVSDWELIVIDDQSSDHSFEIVQRLANEDRRITAYQNTRNMGVARTRNFGIEKCQGKFIAFLDSDDVWKANKLEMQVALAQSINAEMVYCSYAIVDSQGQKTKADYMVPAQTDFKHLLCENVILCSAMLIRAEVVKKIRFNTDFYHEDFVLALDILKAGYTAAGCTEVLLNLRYINHSRSFNKGKSASNRWKVYRDYLKLPWIQSIGIMVQYGIAGLKKYR